MNRYYSGLIVVPNVTTKPCSAEYITEEEIKNNLVKIQNLPKDISEKILQVPQFEIFFDGCIPYYITPKDSVKKELPKRGPMNLYYDPIEDTIAYQRVIENVKEVAQKEYEEGLIRDFGHTKVFGTWRRYISIEARILYEKYGVCCINNEELLNLGLCID